MYATLVKGGQSSFMPRGPKVAAKKKQTKIHDQDRIIVRLPDGMRERLAALAEANGRSMTAETVAAIEKHLQSVDRITEIWEFIQKHRKMLDDMAEYDLFGKDGIFAELDRLQAQVREIDERVRPEEYRD
jgi:predicted DNA-binding protein